MSIPLSSHLPEDIMCWDLEKDGIYSIRSTYKALVGDVWSANEEAPSGANALWQQNLTS